MLKVPNWEIYFYAVMKFELWVLVKIQRHEFNL